jgi:hypothetical protein
MESKMRRSIVVGAAAAAVANLGISAVRASSIASDSASNSTYTVNNAFAGLNGGSGFGPWAVDITGTGGDYISGGTYDSTGVVTEPNFDIWNDTNDGNGGGEYGTDVTTAIRPFTGGAMTPDQIFKFSDVLHYANQTQGGGSGLGWSLEDSSGNVLFDFHTAGGAPGYYLTDATQSDTVETSVPYNYQVGDTFSFELNDASGDYTFTVSSAPGGNVQGGSQTFTGQISMASGGPSQFAAYNNNGEGGSDIEFNNLALTSATSPQQWISTTSGNWNASGNWNGVVPNAPGAEADFYSSATSNTTVYTDQAVTAGTINFNNSFEYEITGTGSLTLKATSGDAEVIVQNGTQEINLPTTIASNTIFNVAAGANLVIANPLTIDSGDSITTSGGGTVTYQSIITVGSNASIVFGNSTYANTLSVASGGKATLQGSGSVVEVDYLSNGGTVDITKNELLINYAGGADPESSIITQLRSGFNNGGWNGAGIMSSAAQTTHAGLHYGIGWSDGADKINGHSIVNGLSSGQIEIKYTLVGDANLDGTVNGADFSILAANFGLGYTNWDQGNFLFTPTVNGSDFSALAANFGQGDNVNAVADVSAADMAALDAFAAANGLAAPSFASVPEPATAGLLLVVGAAALSRRRRCAKRTR